eukprot:gene343-biopygen529
MLHQFTLEVRCAQRIDATCTYGEIDGPTFGQSFGSRIVPAFDHQDLEALTAEESGEETPGETGSCDHHSRRVGV